MVFWVLLSTKQIWHIQTAWSRIIAESIHLHEPSWTNLCHFVTPNQSTNLCNLWTSRVFDKITCPNPHLTTKSGLGGWSQFFGWRKPLIEMHTPPTHLPMSSMMKRMSGILCILAPYNYLLWPLLIVSILFPSQICNILNANEFEGTAPSIWEHVSFQKPIFSTLVTLPNAPSSKILRQHLQISHESAGLRELDRGCTIRVKLLNFVGQLGREFAQHC